MARHRNPRGQGEALRTELLAAARSLLDAAGSPDAVTVRGVAAAVGVAPNAVYLHFEDRLDLLATLAATVFEEWAAELNGAVSAFTDPVERIMAGHRTYCRLAVEAPGAYRLVFGSLLYGYTGPAQRFLLASAAAYYQTLVDACQGLIDAGLLPGRDARTLAPSVWAFEHGWCELTISGASGMMPDAESGLRALLGLPDGSAPQSTGASEAKARARSRAAVRSSARSAPTST